jgi:hypothetical protein
VLPPTSSIVKYSGGADLAVVSRELQVRYVLQGNVQKLGTRWRVSVQLTDTQRRKIVVSEKYDLNLVAGIETECRQVPISRANARGACGFHFICDAFLADVGRRLPRYAEASSWASEEL